MNILAVDAVGEILSVAVQSGEKIVKARRSGQNKHDDALLPAIESLLKRAKLKWEDLDAIAVPSGPGRFTGIRIGMSFAATAGMWLKIPALALSRLEAAAVKSGETEVLAALPGWKGEVYHQRFKRGAAVGEAQWSSPEEWKNHENAASFFVDTDAADLLPVALRRLKAKKIPPFAPFYLKPAGYEKNRR